MKPLSIIIICLLSHAVEHGQIAEPSVYLNVMKQELGKQWPDNRIINIVFHGHSVPAGYFKTPDVNTLGSYPHLTLTGIKKKYPYAVVNCIVTATGGENSVQGNRRFDKEVLVHSPDILFIDYALNDRYIGLQESEKAWRQMIEKALAGNIKVFLMTPTPDLNEDISDNNSLLEQHNLLLKKLAKEYKVGLIDSYNAFKKMNEAGKNLQNYMSQNNHPNEQGHEIVKNLIMQYF